MPVEQLIYTDLPRGQGVDPNCGGYQIKACSPNLSDELRSRLDGICRHYGAAVYLSAPRAAREAEQQWRIETSSVDEVPEAVLRGFPTIWTYDQLDTNTFALTRVGYCGLTHDNRPGNFLAHALILTPEDLSEFNFNPLTLARGGFFRADDHGSSTALISLPHLANDTTESSNGEILRRDPYRQHVPDMLRALCGTMAEQRPLLFGLTDWSEGNTLVESLLNLLPPSARSRITFTTYESDRQWTHHAVSGSRTANQTAAHQLLVLSSYDSKPFDLRADEYQRAFAVFNFVEQKFSEWPTPPGTYVRFAIDCLNQRALDQMRRHHELVDTLGVGIDVGAWDALVCARQLSTSNFRIETLPPICAAFSSVAQQPAQAHKALELLRPFIARLAAADDFQTLETLVEDLSKLVVRAERHPERQNLQSFLATLSDRMGEAFGQGRGRTVTALLQMCGAERTDHLLAVLDGAFRNNLLNTHRDRAYHKAMVVLFVEGLILAGTRSEYAPAVNQWIVATFKISSEMNLLPELWSGIGDRLVKPRLSGDWSADKERLIQDLLVHATPTRCGEANVWLNLHLMAAKPPQGQALVDRLIELARACGNSHNGTDLAREVIVKGLSRLPTNDHEAMAEILAQLAEDILHTDVGEVFFQAYLKESKQITPNQFQLRRRLASAGKFNVVSLELIEELTPWNSDHFRIWSNEVLLQNKRLLDTVRKTAATRLRTASGSANSLSLAKALLPDKVESTLENPGLSDLYQAVAVHQPLAPISDQWAQIMAQIPEGEGRARLRLLAFMRDVEQRARTSDWSIQQFQYDHQAWKSDVKLLSHDDNQKLVAWCLSQFENVGINDFREAEILVKTLAALGVDGPTEIADRVLKLIDKRDLVTRVNTAMAFARCYLEKSEGNRQYGSIALSILKRSDKQMRNLFEAHLKDRFAPDSSEYQKKLEDLCEVLSIALPKKDSLPSRNKLETNDDKSLGSSDNPGVLGNAKRSWRRLLGSK